VSPISRPTRIYVRTAPFLLIPLAVWATVALVGFERCFKGCVPTDTATTYQVASGIMALLCWSAAVTAVIAWVNSPESKRTARASVLLGLISILALVPWFFFGVAVGVTKTT